MAFKRSILQNWQSLYNLTDAEKALEPEIARLGVRYRVQHPVWALGVFPDFALLDTKTIFEVDDKGHREPAKRKADAVRTAKLEALGWKVYRTTNERAISNPKKAVDDLLDEAGLGHLKR